MKIYLGYTFNLIAMTAFTIMLNELIDLILINL
jgi:hypothetical protein